MADEAKLRDRILPPLLHELGFVDVRGRHGPREEGKDLLARRTSILDTQDWIGFVVKAGDLNAQVASSAGIRTVVNQVEQVLDHPITDPLTSDPSTVRECWVLTSGLIPGHALDEVAVTLHRHHLDRVVRWLDGKKIAGLLVEFIDRARLSTLLELPLRAGEEAAK